MLLASCVGLREVEAGIELGRRGASSLRHSLILLTLLNECKLQCNAMDVRIVFVFAVTFIPPHPSFLVVLTQGGAWWTFHVHVYFGAAYSPDDPHTPTLISLQLDQPTEHSFPHDDGKTMIITRNKLDWKRRGGVGVRTVTPDMMVIECMHMAATRGERGAPCLEGSRARARWCQSSRSVHKQVVKWTTGRAT